GHTLLELSPRAESRVSSRRPAWPATASARVREPLHPADLAKPRQVMLRALGHAEGCILRSYSKPGSSVPRASSKAGLYLPASMRQEKIPAVRRRTVSAGLQ